MEPAALAIAAEAGPDSGVAVAEMVQAGVLTDLSADVRERSELELLQAISVAVAYYEDSLAVPPYEVLVAGTLAPAALEAMLADSGLGVRTVVQDGDLLTGTTVSRGLLAGLRGALKS